MGSRDGACRGDGGADEVGLVVTLAHALPPLEHLVTARAGATVRVKVRVRFRVEVRVRLRLRLRVTGSGSGLGLGAPLEHLRLPCRLPRLERALVRVRVRVRVRVSPNP